LFRIAIWADRESIILRSNDSIGGNIDSESSLPGISN